MKIKDAIKIVRKVQKAQKAIVAQSLKLEKLMDAQEFLDAHALLCDESEQLSDSENEMVEWTYGDYCTFVREGMQ